MLALFLGNLPEISLKTTINLLSDSYYKYRSYSYIKHHFIDPRVHLIEILEHFSDQYI